MRAYREDCNGQCQLTGKEAVEVEGWNKADKVLLSILSLFGECVRPTGAYYLDDVLHILWLMSCVTLQVSQIMIHFKSTLCVTHHCDTL